jgi:TPR repeat protein
MQIQKNDIIENIERMNVKFDESKRKWFNETVKSIIWRAAINEKNTGIPGFETPEFDYSDIQVIEIELNIYKDYNDFYYLANIINRHMPRQLMLLIKYENKYRVILSRVRENIKNPLFTVVAETIITYWIYPGSRSPVSDDILSCLDIHKYRPKDMRDLYERIYAGLICFERKCLLLYAGPFIWFLSDFLNMDDNDQEYLLDYIKCRSIGEIYKPPDSRKFKDKFSSRSERKTIPKELYDYEDVWHVLQEHPEIKSRLENKKIFNMVVLMNKIYFNLKINYYNKRFVYVDKIGNSYYTDSLFEDDLSYPGIRAGKLVDNEEYHDPEIIGPKEKLHIMHLPVSSNDDILSQAAAWEKGKDRKQNINKAIELYIEAAKRGRKITDCVVFPDTMYKLGIDFLDEKGIPKNREKAVELFARAAEQGNIAAQLKVAHSFEEGDVLKQDGAQAVLWYTQAANQGSIEAQLKLADCYEKGEITGQDFSQAIHWYTLAAGQGKIEAQVRLAAYFEEHNDFNQSLHWYTQAANQDNAEAQIKLAGYYEKGEIVGQDLVRALNLYSKVIAKGVNICNDLNHPEVINNLAFFYENGTNVEKNLEQAYLLYSRAAEQGNVKAICNLARCYERGIFVDVDFKQALNLYAKAAENGDVEAKFKLGRFYDKGLGVSENKAEAFRWYKMTAEEGYLEAQYAMGRCYEKGNGVDINYEKAADWYEKAARQDHPRAQCNLARCYEHGKGVIKDESKAKYWNRKSAEQGYAKSQFFYARSYEYGENKNYYEAVLWYTKAADQGYLQAQCKLARCYENGKGTIKNEKIAAYWYKKAAEKDYAEAQFQLALCCENGKGVPEDMKEAAHWYSRAAENGHIEAMEAFAFCCEKGEGVEKNKELAAYWYQKAQAGKDNS